MSKRNRIRRAWRRYGKRTNQPGIEDCNWGCTPRKAYKALAVNVWQAKQAWLVFTTSMRAKEQAK